MIYQCKLQVRITPNIMKIEEMKQIQIKQYLEEGEGAITVLTENDAS